MNDPEIGWIIHGKSDRGEFILDNLTDHILLWSKTPFRYYKRQSQDDPDTWVWIKDDRWAFRHLPFALHNQQEYRERKHAGGRT